MDPRYPTGKFAFDPAVTTEKRRAGIAAIGAFPAELKAALAALPPTHLDRPYREGGWTARQVVHHVADSHINAYVRTRLILTETKPPLKPYDETLWANLADVGALDPAVSVQILEPLHQRWHHLLQSLPPADFARPGHHPEHGDVALDFFVQLYAWHGRHHIGHIKLVQ